MFERILVGLDFSSCAAHALEVTRQRFPVAQRRLLYVAERESDVPSRWICWTLATALRQRRSAPGRRWTRCVGQARRSQHRSVSQPKRFWPRRWPVAPILE